MNSAINKVIKNHIKLAIFSTIAVILLVTGVTYSLFQTEHENTKNQTISLGDLSIDLTSTSGSILIKDIYPKLSANLSEAENLYSFTITNTGDYLINYEVYLSDNTSQYLINNAQYSSYTPLSTEYYQYIDYKMDGLSTANNLNQIYNSNTKRMVVLRGYLAPGASEDHTLQFWLDAGETTSTGAPNSLNGTILALNINMEATAGNKDRPSSEQVLASLGLDELLKSEKISFNKVATTDEGIYSAKDNYGTSYYFRGASTRNYVYYAGFYWRIIRINGDGSLRMIYDGTSPHANGEASLNRFIDVNTAYNSADTNNALYSQSSAKLAIDTWYKANIVDAGYSSDIADRIFCNDTNYTLKNNIKIYNPLTRIITNHTPSLICDQAGDESEGESLLTVENNKLTYPVGMITADEVSFAGGVFESPENKNYYLYKGSLYWTMSPSQINSNGNTNVIRVASKGYLSENVVTENAGNNRYVAPVINLKKEVAQALEGSGTMSDPFKVTESGKTLAALGLSSNPNKPNFNALATADEGIYKTLDNDGTSYYFRGAAENNYVNFAGFYWRIIRVNGDGTLRLIYDGTKAYANGTSNSDRVINANTAFNASNSANPRYSESTAKTVIDSWYAANLSRYKEYIADTTFCNDTTLSDTKNFSAKTRLTSDKITPSLVCPNASESTYSETILTVSNGKLTNPIGMITADEIALAGGGYDKDKANKSYYLYKGKLQWTMTPFTKTSSNVSGIRLASGGYMSSLTVNVNSSNNGFLAPVINLTKEAARSMTGSGTVKDPYVFSVSDKILAALGLSANTGTPDFSQVATTDEGIFEAEDNYGASYYFRGAVTNNYVKFAGFYWRIIRINGDGSLRIIYDGTTAHANGEASTDRRASTSAFNTSKDDNAYVGYMYGLTGTTTDANRCLILENDTVIDKVSTYTSESACTSAGGKWTETAYEATHANVKDSTIKGNLDSWYKTNIVDKGYSSAVSDTLFCNDRSLSSGTGAGTSTSYYKSYNRLYTNKNPSLKCTQQNDAFTVSDTVKGNGDLTYPVGLITIDEASLAGGKFYASDGTSNNPKYYLYKGVPYWPASPYNYFSSSNAYSWIIHGIGSLNFSNVNISSGNGLVPVINLTADYCQQLRGSGTTTDPYTAS